MWKQGGRLWVKCFGSPWMWISCFESAISEEGLPVFLNDVTWFNPLQIACIVFYWWLYWSSTGDWWCKPSYAFDQWKLDSIKKVRKNIDHQSSPSSSSLLPLVSMNIYQLLYPAEVNNFLQPTPNPSPASSLHGKPPLKLKGDRRNKLTMSATVELNFWWH